MKTVPLDLGTIVPDLSKNKVQQEFMKCNARFQNFSGGFGSGKTTACNLKIHLLCESIANNFAVVCRKTYPDLRDTTRKSFFEIADPNKFHNWRESENAYTYKNGSTVIFRHFENGKIKVGASIGAFFIDQAEEAEESIFKALVGRLRRNVPRRMGIMAMNPNGQDWQYRLFVKEQGKNPNFQHFDSTTYDNEANLPLGYIQDMLATFPQEWVERFVYGKWNKMSGLIYHEFSEENNLVDPFTIPAEWPKVRGLDWGVDAPATCSFVAMSPQGVYYVFDEYGDIEKTPEEHARAIHDVSRKYDGAYKASVIDKTAFHRDNDLKSVADKYRMAGIPCVPATTDLMARILLVKGLLKSGRLRFFRGKTDKTVEEMKTWKWGARRNGHEMPASGNDHYLDAKGYALYWMDRKKFYGATNDRPVRLHKEFYSSAKLERGAATLGSCDSVTGLPA